MYTIRFNTNHEMNVLVNKNLYNVIGETVEVYIGAFKQRLDVKIDESLERDTISIPSKYKNTFLLPKDIPYEVKISKERIIIGPLIGILGCRRKQALTQELLDLLLLRFEEYESINGLVYVFTEDSVDPYKQWIKGYYYQPILKKWKKGIFPYPHSIIVNKDSMSFDMYHHFISFIGHTIFYSRQLSKWTQHEMISKDEKLRNFVPPTIKLTKFKSLLSMLKQYGAVYLKPNQSYQGMGMYFIQKRNKVYYVKDEFSNSYVFHSTVQLNHFIKKRTGKINYLIQKSVAFQSKNRNVDFRVYLQKNREKNWVCSGITSRISKEGSIITNSRNRDRLLVADEGFSYYYSLDDEKSQDIQASMIHACTRIATLIEGNGIHLADLAFDIIVDSDLKVWVLELQGGYSLERKKHEIPPNIFSKLTLTPFQYAKTLAGF
ncbi:YheC/YheD family protein [Bacillus salitolerans]|uniref:YheC/YheD family protein n=1 Tax=Bacillus salitolerans TaxID=1437434 RepID=A0ABW4LJU3_9BACI